ncbi:hypothetical protein ACLDXX_12170 [Acinetobacter baumannii]
MIKTPLSTVLGGAFWTPEATVINGAKLSFETVMKKLFANNEQGFFYDPNDLSTMYQDAAGNIPVTDAGQPVGLIRDKSGRNNHAFATSSATRPILRKNATTGAYYLEFDGSDDFLVTSSINFTATDKISLFAGVVKFATSVRILCELSADMNTNAGSFYLTAPETADGRYGFKSRGSGLSNAAMTALSSATSANDAAVISASGNISEDTNKIRRNAVATSSTYELGVGNYGNYPLYIGRRAGSSLPFNGHLYSLIGVARLSTDAETTNLEKAIAKNVGVTL